MKPHSRTQRSEHPAPSIAVLIPCRDEAATIAGVVSGFRAALPEAALYVYDNNSLDDTGATAELAGARVQRETRQGKGHVVRRMFADIEADLYVLVDGDGTYEAASAPRMVKMLLTEQLDMVIALRLTDRAAAYRRGHLLGNRVLNGVVAWIFGSRAADMMSGYRVLSRRFVKSFPITSSGFEIETELTIHALELNLPLGHLPSWYQERPEGSSSKLRTYADGFRILKTIVNLVRDQRPLQFFSILAGFLLVLGFALSIPVFIEFRDTGLVPRLPTALLSTGIVLVSFLAFACGLILDSVAMGRKETKRIAYLAIPRTDRPQASASPLPSEFDEREAAPIDAWR